MFWKNAVYRCETDCWSDGNRWRRGDLIVAKKCPPHFVKTGIDPKSLKEKKEQ